jgi:hypothetical protein
VGSTTATGVYPITVTATGGGIIHTASINLTVTAVPLSLTAPGITGTVGIAVSYTLTVTGGQAPYIYSVSSGKLPAGITLNASTGAISGTPTAVTSGNSGNIIFEVIDSAGAIATAKDAVTISNTSSKTHGNTQRLASAARR